MRPSHERGIHAGRHRSPSLPMWCQISVQILGTLLVAAALVAGTVTDPDRAVPVQQAELR